MGGSSGCGGRQCTTTHGSSSSSSNTSRSEASTMPGAVPTPPLGLPAVVLPSTRKPCRRPPLAAAPRCSQHRTGGKRRRPRSCGALQDRRSSQAGASRRRPDALPHHPLPLAWIQSRTQSTSPATATTAARVGEPLSHSLGAPVVSCWPVGSVLGVHACACGRACDRCIVLHTWIRYTRPVLCVVFVCLFLRAGPAPCTPRMLPCGPLRALRALLAHGLVLVTLQGAYSHTHAGRRNECAIACRPIAHNVLQT